MSGCRSARAQKSLGLRYMKEKKWTKCADSLQLSLKVNPLQVSKQININYFSYNIRC